tara:strand:- start:192 stop:821 length:630 start_codon:yes stop_codon:yes gene_type:complete
MRGFELTLRIYLVTFLGCATPRPPAPPTTVARAMETRTISADTEKVLKASINVLQDLSYTVDVINPEMGLLTASRTTQGEQALLTKDKDETVIDAMPAWQKACLAAGGVILVMGLLSIIFGGGNNGEDNDDVHVIDWGRNNDSPEGPVIHRYRVTINVDEAPESETKVRVSAQGEKEQDGNILATGGIHEAEFFQRFFANLDKALFLEQ